ncbi:MAG: CBS domain-containing protein, partial [Anaerolineales bacterium]|nr:CBS domain-containing protein [Anaerolineales bacterium]
FITHDLNEALRVGNHVAIMRDGAIVQIGTPIEIITQPADEYVARFMADVDQSRVLTAEFVMRPAHHLTHQATVNEALQQMEAYNVDALYVIDQQGMPDGVVRRSYLYNLQAAGKTNLREALIGNYPTTSPLTELTSIYNVYEEHLPLAVVNDRGRLQGVIYASDIINALANTDEESAMEAVAQSQTLVQEIA